MGMPVLGPPTSTPFSPLAPTLMRPPEQPQSFSAADPGALRPDGSAYGLERLRGRMTETYEPPPWAKQILTVDPLFQSPGDAGTASGVGYQRPGLPERVNLDPFGNDPVGAFLGGDAGVAMGMVPGQQRGGATHGIATTPMTLANFSTWGREGVLALATSLMGKDYQQPENAAFGQQPGLVGQSGDVPEAFVSGVAALGDLVFKAFDAPLKWYRDSNAFNRGKSVRDLFSKGQATPFLTEAITTAIFGGQERFTIEGIRTAAAREGIDYLDAIAKKFDLDPRIVAAIAQNPYMTDAELGAQTDGSPLSVDPVSNLLLEGTMQGAMLAVGGLGVAKGAAMLGRSGVGALEALGTTLRGGQVAGELGMAGRAATAAGWLGRKALQINSWNTTAGWTIRGAEWGIKQLAVIGGNDELVKAMDRLMWQMPLSMNPGWNLIDGFSSHPIDAYRNIRQGQVAIGRRGSPGYVGQLDLRGMALRDGSTGETMSIRLAGRDIKLGRDSEEFRTLGRIRDLTPDDMHGLFFARLGWSKANLERVFGDGNPYDLTWDDLRNTLFHVALEAVRESKGPVGRLEGLHLPTMAERTAAFVRDNSKGAFKVLEDNLKGTSSSMVDLFRSDFWNLAARNDTSMGVLKASLGAWDPDMAFLDFASWVRASKIVRNAVESGRAAKGAVPVFRKTVNREFLGQWLKALGERYQPDEVVPLSFINQLKRFGGAVEMRGEGSQLVRGRQVTFTRSQLEDIIDSVLAEDDLAQKAANAVPRDQAAAFRKGIDPGQDPLEDARVLGISTTQLDIIRAAEAGKIDVPPPMRLVQIVAADLGKSVDSIRSLKPEDAWAQVLDWWNTKVAAAADTAKMRDNLDQMAQAITARAADGRMDPADAAAMVAGLGRIRDEVLAPLDPKVASSRPSLFAQWQATAQEGLILASEIESHLKDPVRDWRPAEGAPGVVHAIPKGVPAAVIRGYEALIAKVLKDGSPLLSDFDRARLEDPAIHPLLKDEILANVLAPTDQPALAALRGEMGGKEPRQVVAEMLADGGIDATDPAAGAAQAAAQTEAYIAKGAELGARAQQLARRFQTLGGAYSDELADTIDRIGMANAVAKAKAPKGQRIQHIGALPMDPEEGARRSVSAQNTERSSAMRDMAKAQKQLDAAERALNDAASTPTAFDEATMEWGQAKVFRDGKADAKKAAALAHAAELVRTEGAITEVRYEPAKGSAYVVYTARPKAAAPEAPAPRPVLTTLMPNDQPGPMERDLDRLLTAPSTGARNDAAMDLQLHATSNIEDPAYMPGGELEPLREMIDRRMAALEKDIADNPAADPANDPRITAQGILAEAQARFRKRDLAAQSALETAAVADGADPGLIDQAVQGRMDLGGTAESAGAVTTDIATRTQGGPVALPQRTFADDIGASAVAKVQQPLRSTLDPEVQQYVDAAKGMGINVVVVGWGDGVARFEPVPRPTIILGPNFPAEDVAQAAEIIQHEVGHALQYHDAIRGDLQADFPELGYYLPAGTPAPGFPDMVAGERDIYMAYGPDGTLEPSHAATEAFAHAFTAYGRGDPMDPRARAYMARIAGRQEIGAGEPSQPHGFFPDPGTNEPIGYQLMVVDASQLVTSADEGFDQALQPRMRFARTSSDEQIQSIASGPDPARLLGTESGAQGTPVILPDGQVLAGNGRVTGIRQAHVDGTAGAYTAALGEQAAGIANPVLVRVIDVPREEAIRLAVQLNFETGMPLADQALGLSRLLTDEDIGKLRISASQSLEDAMDSSANDGFVNAFLAHIPQDFRKVVKDTDGSLNQQGKELMAATLVARFTGAADSPAGQMLVATLFEGDPEVKSLASGMDAIGALIQAQVESAGKPWGGVTPAFAEDLIPALQRVFDLRGSGMDLRDVQASMLSVGELFGPEDGLTPLTPTQQALAHNLALMGRAGPESGATALRKLLRTVARQVRGHDEAGVEAMPMDLFGGSEAALPDPTYPDVVNDAFRAMNMRRPEGSQYLLLPGRDGITHVKDAAGTETARLHPVVDDPIAVVNAAAPVLADVVLSGNDWRVHTDAISRSTGKVVLNVDSEAEASALRSYLAGDESARLPAAYRVVDGAIEPLDEARYARVRDLANREYKKATSKEQANAYLDLLESPQGQRLPAEITRGGRVITDPVEVAAALASDWLGKPVPATVIRKINGYLRAPTAGDPALPGLRDALQGRDFEVRGPDAEPVLRLSTAEGRFVGEGSPAAPAPSAAVADMQDRIAARDAAAPDPDLTGTVIGMDDPVPDGYNRSATGVLHMTADEWQRRRTAGIDPRADRGMTPEQMAAQDAGFARFRERVDAQPPVHTFTRADDYEAAFPGIFDGTPERPARRTSDRTPAIVAERRAWAEHERARVQRIAAVDPEVQAEIERLRPFYVEGDGKSGEIYTVESTALDNVLTRRKNAAGRAAGLSGSDPARFRGATAPDGGRPTEIVAGSPRDIPDDYEARTGLSPETPVEDRAAATAQAAGTQRVVTPADQVHQQAAQRAAGAPVNRGPHVVEQNAPDAVERTRLAQQARDTAAAQLEAARARVDALGPEQDMGPVREILSGSELDLYHRYIDSTANPTAPGRQPRNVNEVIDLLTSLDLGMPPLKGTMSPQEMETLRMALLRVLNARLDDLGVDPPTGAARRGGVGIKGVSRGVGTRVDAEPVITTPEDLSADLAEVVRTLQGRVYEAADALDGWEGTQYEIGLMPSKGRDGGPLSPRLPMQDWIGRLDELVPGLGEELLHGRKRAWPEREQDARWLGAMSSLPGAALVKQIRGLAHTALDARPERVIAKQAIDRFTERLLADFVGSQDEYLQAIGLVDGMIGAVHEGMRKHTLAGFTIYRRMGLAAPEKFDDWALMALEGGPQPQWLSAFMAKAKAKGIKHPLAEAWRDSDNRVRAYFQQKPGGMADLVEGLYASSAGRAAHGLTRGLTVGYHVARFLIDLRWLGLEAIEAPTLTLFQEGPGAMLEGLGRGAHAGEMPMFMGRDALEQTRTSWAWWLAQSDPGAILRTRERYLLAIVRRRQMAEFPRALREAAAKSPDLAAAVKAFDGGDGMAYLKRLDTDWELAASRSMELDAPTAKRLFTPWFERGVISQKELDELLKAKRYTGHPAIDRELATLAEPWMRPLIERLGALNEQGWNDAARLIFGQTDRSNAQRLANHPLLYWPISYQIKAAKWLGGLLFDRAFGVDTGAGGAVTLGMIHQQHLDRMRTDEQYAKAITGNPTLLFFAQMLFPIAPWDLGVALSPFTRLALSALTADDSTEGYRRNVFSVGAGYTYYAMLPRLFYEQSKPGAWAQGAGVLGDVFEAGQRFLPYSIPVQPKGNSSQLMAAEIQAGQGATPTTTESTGPWTLR